MSQSSHSERYASSEGLSSDDSVEESSQEEIYTSSDSEKYDVKS